MEKIFSRIRELVAQEGITIGALERAIGASKGVLSRAMNNGTDIQSKWLLAIVENYPRLSADWLLRGQGEMMINDGTGEAPSAAPEAYTAEIERLQRIIDKKDKEIKELSREVGKLEGRIEQMELYNEKSASPASSATSARVG